MKRIPLSRVHETATPHSISSRWFVYPVTERVVWLLVNFAPVHPNVLTVLAGVSWFAAAACFVLGTPAGMVGGAILAYWGYGFDTMDGMVARVLERPSKFGAWLDEMVDTIAANVALGGLVVGTYRFRDDDPLYLILGLGLVMLLNWYHVVALVTAKTLGARPYHLVQQNPNSLVARMMRAGFEPSFTMADFEAVVLVLGPITLHPHIGVWVGLTVGVAYRLAMLVLVGRRFFKGPPE